jgi:hypothetical protein
MSATNRSKFRESHPNDYYVTPDWIVEDLLSTITSNTDDKLEYANIVSMANSHGVLDPCAGGRTGLTLPTYPNVLGRYLPDAGVTSLDIREDADADYKGVDFLGFSNDLDVLNQKYGLIISNPPFQTAQEFIERSYDMLVPGGNVIFLLRLGFLGSAKRFAFFQKYKPDIIFVHHKRPSFSENGKTDADYYAHFVFRKSDSKNYDTKMVLI